MRLFEFFTLICSISTFYALCFLKNKRLFLYLLFLASICCVLQYFFEGSRWQFLPRLYSLPLMYIFYKLNKASFIVFQSLFVGFLLSVGFVKKVTKIQDKVVREMLHNNFSYDNNSIPVNSL